MHECPPQMDKVLHDPHDPGGTTKFGISKRYHPDVDVENLTLQEAEEIYRKEYWNPVAKMKDDQFDMVAFECAVNPGIGHVKKWFKFCTTWNQLLIARRTFYVNVVHDHPDREMYVHGWLSRCNDLETFIRGTLANLTPSIIS